MHCFGIQNVNTIIWRRFSDRKRFSRDMSLNGVDDGDLKKDEFYLFA